ncbi:hypothetical protein ACHWQZ_G006496 [Mnemiopsis leidyi]
MVCLGDTATIAYATSLSSHYPAFCLLKPSPNKLFTTTGSFPQEIILHFEGHVLNLLTLNITSSYVKSISLYRMKGWNILEREDSTVELQSIKGEELTDVLEEFAVTHQIDPLPVINKSTVILKNIKDLLVQIKSSVENYDCDEELGGVVISARKTQTCVMQGWWPCPWHWTTWSL